MAGSLLLLLDDIATVLDDVSVMTKVAAKKTAGVLGDDLALNAEQVSGVKANREIPVVWAVAKGSALNKCILVPAALLISAFVPWLVTPLLMLGGAFLCYEGVEKLTHKFLDPHEAEAEKKKIKEALQDPTVDLKAVEKDKIKGAIRTDFILSAEIIVISLGVVSDEAFLTRLGVLVAIAALVTVGVYGLVAGIVKLDDAGLALAKKSSAVLQKVGSAMLTVAPLLMRFLSIAGTAAMFLVGGGIISHAIPALHHVNESLIHGLAEPWATLTGMGWNAGVGILLGAVLVALPMAWKMISGRNKSGSA